jgi:hypothetical protein
MLMKWFLRRNAFVIGAYLVIVIPPMILFPGCACAGCVCIPAVCTPAAKVTGVVVARGVAEGIAIEAGRDVYHEAKDSVLSRDDGSETADNNITQGEQSPNQGGPVGELSVAPGQSSGSDCTVVAVHGSDVVLSLGSNFAVGKDDTLVVFRRSSSSGKVEYVADIRMRDIGQNRAIGELVSCESPVRIGDLARKM